MELWRFVRGIVGASDALASEHLKGGFDDLLYGCAGVGFEDRLEGFVDVGFGEAEHLEGAAGFFGGGVGVGGKEGVAAGAVALDNLVLQFEDHSLGGLETDALDGLKGIDIFGDDGLAKFVGSHRRQQHPGRSGAETGHSGDQAEQFPFVLGGEAIIYARAVPLVQLGLDVHDGLAFTLELLISLEGNLESVAETGIIDDGLGRGKFRNAAGDIIKHNPIIISTKLLKYS